MKRTLQILSTIFVLGCVVSCSSGKSSVNSEPSVYEESMEIYEPSKYEGRIKSEDMTIVDITGGITSPNDPRFYDDTKPIDAYRRKDKVRFYYLDEIDDVYYLTLDAFASIFKDELLSGITSSNTEENGVATWTLTKAGQEVYKISMDANKRTMSVYSGLDESFVKSIYNGKTGSSDYCKTTEEFLKGYENKTKTYSFAKYGFDIFEVDGKFCYPFALLNAETSKAIDRSFLYLSAYKEILEYGMKEQINEASFIINGEEVRCESYILGAFQQQYGDNEVENLKIAPSTLTAFNKKLFYFIMDNYYGLAEVKNIKCMSDYFETFGESEAFLSRDGVIRGSAYAKSIQMLNDLHTSYTYATTTFSESPNGDGSSIYPQTTFEDRTSLANLLTNLKIGAIKQYNQANNTDVDSFDVRYSKDNKYAYFSFDGFQTFNYFGEGEVPESTQLTDSYYLFVKNLNEAKAKGVKNVVIDITTNGGGYVGIMGKLLALLSKDNKSEMFLRADDSGSIQKITTSVDSNKDGKYDVDDCFGNVFNFYIVTSNYSFSCGNAFPFYAQKNGYARIIGQKSGGGECCVFSYTLPTGQGLNYSSPYHIGYYDAKEDKYYGDEKGAQPNIPINEAFYQLFDVDLIGARIDLYNEHLND